MSRRSLHQSDLDDLAVPIRATFTVLPHKQDNRLTDALCWLQEEVGPGEFAQTHGRTFGADAVSFHVRRPEDLARVLEAFPKLELADGTISRAYSSPMHAAPR